MSELTNAMILSMVLVPVAIGLGYFLLKLQKD
ncbi:MAG: PetM of cytochrome b6f complex subunit 7 [Oscillatoriales cyanobacterium SM2_2_1]|nr:PetM of cytochrome b6f complex subunit 7 [Oscillatoriales cyanobacterium SM2_2_1]